MLARAGLATHTALPSDHTGHSGLDPPTSFSNSKKVFQRHSYRLVRWKQGLRHGSVFPPVSSLCRADREANRDTSLSVQVLSLSPAVTSHPQTPPKDEEGEKKINCQWRNWLLQTVLSWGLLLSPHLLSGHQLTVPK